MTAGHVVDDGEDLAFWFGERLAGRYRYRDPMKPHLHPLKTPAGRIVTLASPHDHPHHKGMMFAFRTSELNFWEERGGADGPPGRQEHLGFEAANGLTDGTIGVQERLAWREAPRGDIVADEKRTLTCSYDAARPRFVWHWRSNLTARRDLGLIMSPYSVLATDGRRVNYHGLGIRFVRDFGATGGTTLHVDGVPIAFDDAMGAQPSSVTFEGTFDPDPATPDTVAKASVSVRFDGTGALFAMDAPFAYLAWGPSNLAPYTLSAGRTLDARYEVAVADG